MFYIEIKGDENDADYVTNRTIIHSLDSIVASEDALFDGAPQLRYHQFLELLAAALKKTTETNQQKWEKYNWCRDEYDNHEDHAIRTTINFLESMGFNYNEDVDESEYEKMEDVITNCHEFLSNYIHAGEYGVHTVVSIEVIPVGEIKKYL